MRKLKRIHPIILLVASVVLFITTLFYIPILFFDYKEQQIVIVENNVKEECTIYLIVDGETEKVPLEEYVVGVVAAEMPITFHSEALKAQAIAARTYVLQKTENGKLPIGTTVEDQVFNSVEKRKERWGKSFKENEKKVRDAVQATAGQVILYEDKLITAMFFSTSNGMTENAKNYSGTQVPYLNSVASTGEATHSPKFMDKFEFTLAEWNSLFGFAWNDAMFQDMKLLRNGSGRVQTMQAGDHSFSGRDVREKLKIPSTDFDIAYDLTNKIVYVTTTGYGHGVGMSQYGADVFAQLDWSAEKILTYYYQNTEIKNLPIEEEACLKSS